MLTIDWIRHTTLSVTGAVCYGQTDVEVSRTFEEEAKVVKEQLKGINYDKVYSSPLQRARKLAEFCGLPFCLEKRVMERNFGEWEMKSWNEVFDHLRVLYPNRNNVEHLELMAPPRGETINQLIQRVGDFIKEMQANIPSGRIAVFCHGGVINSARVLKGSLDIEQIFLEVPEYGSITSLTYEKGSNK